MTTNAKATLITAQIFISCLMALSMTFAMSILPFGFSEGWFATWMQRWLTAWPVAFVLSLIIGPVAFKLAGLTMRLLRLKTPA
ncbi:DUF2798 domain-containing protein [Pseudooceanicola spongiae]|jgi:hypothetical protein|uniref:DUF2798 domain-containing protein n=1 Tax=Pseudooceanicola spongiae TaxID=2613965 RepID=A0A7L9WKM9_9RHOB|nr:DUF2798 domain-containing protein [Pseudooceanicola spongiae]QOL79946.1 DUF2798 domain-containing protein [Pseudooceanicola spongiae]|tara:strand:+ start:496 stop:744 length:249 start_codon:yes stop_codon:yes gene_type:complete